MWIATSDELQLRCHELLQDKVIINTVDRMCDAKYIVSTIEDVLVWQLASRAIDVHAVA